MALYYIVRRSAEQCSDRNIFKTFFSLFWRRYFQILATGQPPSQFCVNLFDLYLLTTKGSSRLQKRARQSATDPIKPSPILTSQILLSFVVKLLVISFSSCFVLQRSIMNKQDMLKVQVIKGFLSFKICEQATWGIFSGFCFC